LALNINAAYIYNILLKICGQRSARRTLVLGSGDIWLQIVIALKNCSTCGKGDLSIGK